MNLDQVERMLWHPMTKAQLAFKSDTSLEVLKGLLSLLVRDHRVVVLGEEGTELRYVRRGKQPIVQSVFTRVGWLAQRVLEVPMGRVVRGKANVE